jgi:hypothetical protein
MFGGGRENPRSIGQTEVDLINRWGFRLFHESLGISDYNIELLGENGLAVGDRWVVRLLIRPHVGMNIYQYEVDIRIPNLSDLDIYNVRWVEEGYTGDNDMGVSQSTTTVKKEVPIVFGTKEENT